MSKRLEIPEGFTPGPWEVVWWGNESFPYPMSIHTEDGMSWIARDGTTSSKANALLIALAPDMAAEIERLRAENERLWQALMFLDTFSPEDVAAAETRFGLDVSRSEVKP